MDKPFQRSCPKPLFQSEAKCKTVDKMSAVCNVRNLGTWLDNHLSMKTSINKTCKSGLYHLHNNGRIKRFLSFEDRKSIVQAIVMSRIDYCKSLLYGVAATNLSKLAPTGAKQGSPIGVLFAKT